MPPPQPGRWWSQNEDVWGLEQAGGQGLGQCRAGAWFHRFHGNQLSGAVRLHRRIPSHPGSREGGGFGQRFGKKPSVVRGCQAPSSGVPSRPSVLLNLPPSPGWGGPRHVVGRVWAEALADLSSNPPGDSVSISEKWGRHVGSWVGTQACGWDGQGKPGVRGLG